MSRNVGAYSPTQKFLHWSIAILVGLQFLEGDYISHYNGRLNLGIADGIPVPFLAQSHVVLGILTLVLVVWRVALILLRGKPQAPADEDPRLKLVAHATHLVLYLVLILAPLSGLANWFGHVKLAADAHDFLTSVLGLFVFLHIAGALYHQLILQNNLLARNMPAPVLAAINPLLEKTANIIAGVLKKAP